MNDYSTAELGAILSVWGPRILGAALILLVAFLIGRAIKWAIARTVDKAPAIARHNQGLEPRRTVGANLGEVAYWLVLLIGVVAALNVLQLAQVAGPLNALLTKVMAYIPNIVGAGLIFFVGFIVATLARRVVTAALSAVKVDRWMSHLGLSSPAMAAAASTAAPTDPTLRPVGAAPAAPTPASVANAVGLLVFVLILIPVTIAALETLNIQAISGPAIAVLSAILGAIPGVLAAGIVLAIGFLIGRWIAGVIERVLPATGFDRALGGLSELSSYRSRADGMTAAPAAPRVTPSKVVANIVLFAILAFAAVEAARLLNFAGIAVILASILSLAGKIVVGGAIIAIGVLVADMLANLITRSAGEQKSFAAVLVRWTAIALAVAMGLRFMGIADEIVILAFGLTLGAAAVAAALAFGLGGRDAAGRLADGWVQKIQGGFAAAPARSADGRPALHAQAPSEPRSILDDGEQPPASPI